MSENKANEEIKVYGNYYRMRKGFGVIPQDITVIKLNEDEVTFCWGHYTKEEFENMYKPVTGIMKKDKIITKLSEKQRIAKEKKERELEKLILEGERMKEIFINGSCDW